MRPLLLDSLPVITSNRAHAHHRDDEGERPTRSLVVAGDALDVLAELPAGCADMAFVDPPYRLSNGGSTCRGGRRAAVDKGAWDASRGGADADHAWHRRWLRLLQRALAHSGTAWVTGTHHAIFSVGHAMQLDGWHVLNLVAWFKPNAAPNLGCRQLTHSCEMVLWAAPRATRPLAHVFDYDYARRVGGGKQLRDMWPLPARLGRAEVAHGRHPTQKPEALVERCVLLSTGPGATVIDPFMGGGTTGAVCRRLGRSFVGVELDRGYYDVAATRIGATAPRGTEEGA